MTGNEFVQNSASDGGAVRWLNTNFTTSIAQSDTVVDDSNTYRSNYAIYGNNSGSYPASIKYLLIDTGIPGTGIDVDKKEIRIAPGQKFQLEMQILDKDGNIYSNEQRAIATIDF